MRRGKGKEKVKSWPNVPCTSDGMLLSPCSAKKLLLKLCWNMAQKAALAANPPRDLQLSPHRQPPLPQSQVLKKGV